MELVDVAGYISKGLYLVLILSMPSIIIAALVGTLFALLQALTQIQEQTLSFAVKLIATMAVLAFTLRWMGGEMFQYTQNLFDVIPYVGR
ncbi:MAG: type III secretion system export apparatus subunit SctS [Pseudomonadota bacterium]